MTDLQSLMHKVIPHFNKYPLRDDKDTHFLIFSQVVTTLLGRVQGESRSDTLARKETIVDLVYHMNIERLQESAVAKIKLNI